MCSANLIWNLALLSLVTSTVQKSKVHSVSQCLNVQSRLNELQQFTVSKQCSTVSTIE